MDPNRDAQDDPAPAQRRPRAPTITIDTTAATSTPDVPHDARANLGASPTSPQEDAISPSTVVDPAAAQWIASQNMLAAQDPYARPELRAETSFDSRDSRPRSPHNVSSPITARGNDRAFLSVPTTARSRQNSVDDDVETSRSFVSSQGDTLAVSGSNAEKTGFHSHHLSNDKLMKDDTALQPDQGKESDFQVDNNPFAFSPGQLNKLLNPKSLAAFYQIGGLAGLEKGVQSDRKAGLSIEENNVPQHVTYEQATSHLALKSDGRHKEEDSAAPARPHPAAGGDGSFVDRKRVFKDNRLPEKKGKSLLQLMWITYQDKVLMLLTAAAVVSLAIGIYQSVGGEHKEGESRVEWVEGVAIVAAIVIVVVVGSLNDYSKERQFAKLNKKKQDRDVKVVRSGRIMEISVYDILVGDVVHLEPGDLVPVDGLLIEGFNVKCDESQATGESDIIKKKAAADVFAAIENHEDVKKMDPFILSGARVMEGRPGSSGSALGSSAVEQGGDIQIPEFVKMLEPEVKEILLKSIVLNSTAFEGEVDGEKTFIGSKTESALLLLAQAHLGMGPVSEERANAHTLQLIPFDSGRKCMGIVIQLPSGGARLLVKGASEIVVAQCSELFGQPSTDASLVSMTVDNHKMVNGLIESYASRSLRTIGLAYKDFPQWPPRTAHRGDADKNEIHFEDLFRNMVFVGMVGIQDPLREGVPEAVRTCQGAGVCVRMVTGDNKITAQAIAKECGILQPHSVVMEGPEFRNLTKYEQMEILPRLHVLARSSPEDKRVLVKRLKEQGEIVAVTGDGTNDAPALKTADVGFSMGIAGTEVAKEASAIILMDDNFNSIVKALMWGRAVNDAVKRFLQFQLTVNITAVVLTFVTSVSSNGGEGAVSVLTAVQLLWVNLIMDTLAALALATDPPQRSVLLRKPERRNASIISTTMWKMIIGQAIYQLAITFMLFYGYDHLDLVKNEMNLSPERFEAQVRTLVFNTFVWMQIFNQWNNRRLDNRFNIFEGLTQNYFFVAISSIMIGGQILIIFVGGAALSIAPDKQTALMWGIAIVLGFLSIPFGIVIRLIPDEFVERLIPDYLKRKSKESGPKLTVDDEEFGQYPEALADVRDELTFLKRMKGGRLNNLKFAVQHPRETFVTYSRSPTHSRSNSVINPAPPATPPRQASISEAPPAPTPESRRRSRSNRSRSNSALGAPTVMAGLIAAGVAANWTPNDPRRNRSDAGLAGESREGISRQNSTSGHVSIQEEGHEVECPAAAKGQTESTSSMGGAQH
ncbi:plasma membrane calcium-transporting ATPase [Verticillium alfalfae VaMs.102]|uniref:Calcium-transporting ATPase n=1 Tax=Verticillium alfalfae (strain VaMs.102 / ATCC MYA-4576 / FGSC 10136) TaxID=526221 RepID=C9STB8_VERA1|nr:plasma membrane calcium-transporting ATPase [Verticillium alfalfae VaMs.102]EEY22033.1 plasma membrane calcium-transporting ATPase [Verticillium alfalfae VaMs.102]